MSGYNVHLSGSTHEALRLLAKKHGKAALRKASKWAHRDAVRAMRTDAARLIRARKGFKHGLVVKNMTSRMGMSIEAASSLTVHGFPVPLHKYPGIRYNRRGASAKVTASRRVLIRGAFKATMKSGHTGAFMRVGTKRVKEGKKGLAWKRPGQGPIRELWGSGVSSGLKGTEKRVSETGQRAFRATLGRLYLAPKGGV